MINSEPKCNLVWSYTLDKYNLYAFYDYKREKPASVYCSEIPWSNFTEVEGIGLALVLCANGENKEREGKKLSDATGIYTEFSEGITEKAFDFGYNITKKKAFVNGFRYIKKSGLKEIVCIDDYERTECNNEKKDQILGIFINRQAVPKSIIEYLYNEDGNIDYSDIDQRIIFEHITTNKKDQWTITLKI